MNPCLSTVFFRDGNLRKRPTTKRAMDYELREARGPVFGRVEEREHWFSSFGFLAINTIARANIKGRSGVVHNVRIVRPCFPFYNHSWHLKTPPFQPLTPNPPLPFLTRSNLPSTELVLFASMKHFVFCLPQGKGIKWCEGG